MDGGCGGGSVLYLCCMPKTSESLSLLSEFGTVVARTGAGLLVVDGGGGSVLYLCTYAQELGELVLAG